jgi:hypothetical protein
MHDLRGLIDRMGGNDEVSSRLDDFFSFAGAAAAPVVVPKAQNQATLFGIAYYGNQYAPGNEHDLQAPFLYDYAGAPWKTQAVARSAASLFTPTTDGLPGNDDLGALSGWLVWTMLGIYPMTPGAPLYATASPVFERAVVHRPGRSDLVIEAPGASPVAKYVSSATLGGSPLSRAWVTEDELDGATLRLQMSELPNMEWGAGPDAAPPSLSTHATSAFGCRSSSPSLEPTDVSFTESSHTSGQFSDKTVFEARLTDSDGHPIAGQELSFELSGTESPRTFSATTNMEGVGAFMPTLEEKPGLYQVTVRFAGGDAHEGDADTTSFEVEKEDTDLMLTVEGTSVRARLADLDSPSAGIVGRTIKLYSDSELIGSSKTDGNGVATFALPPGHRGANRTYKVVFESDDYYLGSSAQRGRKGG